MAGCAAPGQKQYDSIILECKREFAKNEFNPLRGKVDIWGTYKSGLDGIYPSTSREKILLEKFGVLADFCQERMMLLYGNLGDYVRAKATSEYRQSYSELIFRLRNGRITYGEYNRHVDVIFSRLMSEIYSNQAAQQHQQRLIDAINKPRNTSCRMIFGQLHCNSY